MEQGGELAAHAVAQVRQAHPGHHGVDQGLVVRHVQKIGEQGLLVALGHGAALLDEGAQKGQAKRRAMVQGFGHERREVFYRHAVLPKQGGKAVVLLLGAGKVWDVVKQQPPHGARHQMLQFPAGPVEQDGFQGRGLAKNLNGHRLPPSIRIHGETGCWARAAVGSPSLLYPWQGNGKGHMARQTWYFSIDFQPALDGRPGLFARRSPQKQTA